MSNLYIAIVVSILSLIIFIVASIPRSETEEYKNCPFKKGDTVWYVNSINRKDITIEAWEIQKYIVIKEANKKTRLGEVFLEDKYGMTLRLTAIDFKRKIFATYDEALVAVRIMGFG